MKGKKHCGENHEAGTEVNEYLKGNHRNEQAGKVDKTSHRASIPSVPKYHHITYSSKPKM